MYGQLPSFIRDNATTYDLSVANVMISWENQQMERASGKTKDVPKLTQEEMQAMIDRVRRENP